MQNNESKKMAHSVVMVSLFTILTLIVSYVPIIGLVAYFFAPLPIAWFSANYDRNASILMSVAGCILSTLLGGVGALLLSIIFITTGIVIGEGIRKKKSKVAIFLSTAITVLITFAIQYIILVNLFSIDFIQTSLEELRASYEEAIKLTNITLQPNMSNEELLDKMFQSLEMAMPALITLGVFFYSIIVIAAIFPFLRKLKVDVPKFSNFSNLKFPKIILWLYFIVLLINFFVKPEVGSALYVVVYNFSIILWVLLTLQGLSFIFYCLEKYELPKFLKGLTAVFAVPLNSFFILVGLVDLGFDVRSFVKGKIQK